MVTPMSPQDVRAAAEISHELGPDYRDAVIESFLDKVGKEIDARVDQRLAQQQQMQPVKQAKNLAFPLAIVSLALGIPLTAIIESAAAAGTQGGELFVVWLMIAIINVAYGLSHRPKKG